jgi:ribosomal protein S7
MTTAEEEYCALIQQIDARIAEIEVLKAHAIDAGTTNVTPGMISERLSTEIARPYENEIVFLKRKRDVESIAFAETFLV